MLIYYEILHRRGAGIAGYAPHEARPTPLFLAAAANPGRRYIRSLPRCAAVPVLYATTAIARECNAHGISATIVFVLANVIVDDGIRRIVVPLNHRDVVVDIAFRAARSSSSGRGPCGICDVCRHSPLMYIREDMGEEEGTCPTSRRRRR